MQRANERRITGQSGRHSAVQQAARTTMEQLEQRRLLTAVLIEDIVTGMGGSSPANFFPVGDTLYFTATTPEHGSELWKTDGTAGGTVMVKDVNPGSAGSGISTSEISGTGPTGIASIGETLYFLATDAANGREVWRSDGTTEGTYRLSNAASFVRFMSVTDSKVFFLTGGLGGATQMFVSDGTVEGTNSTQPLGVGVTNIFPPVSIGNTLYFAGSGRLMQTDGTLEGTSTIKNLGAAASSLTVVDGKLFFEAGSRPWTSDGTEAGTFQLSSTIGVRPFQMRNVNGKAAFVGSQSGTGFELFVSDGTIAGTHMIEEIVPGMGGILVGIDLRVIADRLFFFTGGATWISDGTAEGTYKLSDVIPQVGGARPPSFADISGTLYFAGTNPSGGTELWRSDYAGMNTEFVQDINPGTASSFPANLIAFRGDLYFAANDGTTGSEPWVFPVNEAPVADSQTVTVTQDGQVTISLTGSDFETTAADLSFQITSLPALGTLYLNGTAVAAGDEFLGSPSDLLYVPDAGIEPGAADGFTFVVIDDGDNGDPALSSEAATVTINVNSAGEAGSVSIDGAGVVRVIGSDGADDIIIGLEGDALVVRINGATAGDAIPIGSVTELRVFAGAGNDNIDTSGANVPTYTDGGAGDDHVSAGPGDDVVLGGEGNDALVGASGNDLLIGGAGADRLVGSSGNDVLVAASIAGSIADLKALLAGWALGHSPDTAGELAVESAPLTDDDVDVLTGASGVDWFLFGSEDEITGHTEEDVLTLVE